jgi:2-(1,2-epoxy-1,2-dihydrophenyl)acetyl-CoA isomerase
VPYNAAVVTAEHVPYVDTGTETVRAWVTDGVGAIELNRPERRNALHPDMYDAVPRLIQQFDGDDAVGCIVLTGAGAAFCAGGDVRAGSDRDGAGSDLADNARMVVMLHESPKITLAALNGPAVGAGIGIALAADLRIAATSTRLVGGWVRLAFSGDFGGTWFLTRLLGPARALEFLVDNTPIDAETGLRLGLFNRVVPDDQLRDAALAWARAIAAGPQTAHRLLKENVRDAQHLGLREVLPLESDRMRRSAQTPDHRQAVKRWLEEAATPER